MTFEMTAKMAWRRFKILFDSSCFKNIIKNINTKKIYFNFSEFTNQNAAIVYGLGTDHSWLRECSLPNDKMLTVVPDAEIILR